MLPQLTVLEGSTRGQANLRAENALAQSRGSQKTTQNSRQDAVNNGNGWLHRQKKSRKKKDSERTGDVAELVEQLPSTHKPGLDFQHSINKVLGRWGPRNRIQGHPQILC